MLLGRRYAGGVTCHTVFSTSTSGREYDWVGISCVGSIVNIGAESEFRAGVVTVTREIGSDGVCYVAKSWSKSAISCIGK